MIFNSSDYIGLRSAWTALSAPALHCRLDLGFAPDDQADLLGELMITPSQPLRMSSSRTTVRMCAFRSIFRSDHWTRRS